MQIERRRAFSRIFNFIYFNHIEGMFIEFGVGSGMTLKFALQNARVRNMDKMVFYGVDTFLGFPETNGPEVDFISYQSIVGSRQFSKKMIGKIVNKKNIENLKLVKKNMETDNLEDIVDVVTSKKVAIAHLDMDYYLPTLNALNVLTNSLSVGSVLMFDNFFFFAANDNMGERRAFIEFSESHPEITISDFFTYSWHGKAFVVSSIRS
jgi:O-methyltransferase